VALTVNAQGIRAQGALVINDSDRLEADIGLPGARLPHIDRAGQALQGKVHLTTTDLGLIDLLLTDVQGLEGRFSGDLALSGTLGEPRFDGRVAIDNGAMQIPRLGLTIQPIRIHGHTDVINHLVFDGEAGSGNGHLQVSGKTDLAAQNNWPTRLHITGDSFEVSHIPEATIKVSPDLDVTLNDHDVSVNGRISIPFAQLQPRDITTAATVTEDAVIVNAEQPPAPKWRLTSNIKISLGDRVTFSGFDFDGRLTGAVTVTTEPGQLATASGELSVADGRYLAYRRRLDIERGRLIYTGGPLINPGLDMRAVRHIDNVTAGFKVHGSLNQPRLELFSEPAMEQNDILAYILLGHPLESSTGEEGALLANAALALSLSGGNRLARSIGTRFGLEEIRIESNDTGDQYSVVVGRHLSPKLYISYGVGQVDALNTLTLRYTISDKWQLTAENGEQEGADLLYTIER
jgi:translocation and assembly module TamB